MKLNYFIISALVLFSSLGFAEITKPINFHLVSKGIYRGARPNLDENQVDYLKKIGVRTIVNLQGGDRKEFIIEWLPDIQPGEQKEVIQAERYRANSLGIAFFNYPLGSLDEKVSKRESDNIDKALAIISNPKSHPVYIHCEHGADRTGLVIALYRVFHEGWSPEKAYEEMVEKGHNILHQIFTYSLDDYFFKKVAHLKQAQPLAP